MHIRSLKNFININIAVSKLGCSFGDFIRSFVLLTLYGLKDKFFKVQSSLRLAVCVDEKKIMINIRGYYELMLLFKIFCENEYRTDGIKPNVILDLGGNIGLSTLYFYNSFPNSSIYTVEPDPVIFKVLEQNVNNISNIELVNSAVSGEDGTIGFFTNPSKSTASSMYRRSNSDSEIRVRSITLDTLLNELGVDHVDILKFDIEGAEFDVFKDFVGFDKIGYIIGEVHYDIDDSMTQEEFEGLLKEHFNIKIEKMSKEGRFIIKGVNRNFQK